MSEYPDLRTDLSTMANNKKQNKLRPAVAAATASSSNSTQKKQPATARALPSSMENEQGQNEQPAATVMVSGSQDSIMSNIIKGIKGFTIDSAESIILKNDETILIQPDTKARNVEKGNGKPKDFCANSEDDFESEWAQVDIHGRIMDTDTDSNTEAKDTAIKGISKGKGKAKTASSSLGQDDLDLEWEHVEAENSLNDNTIFTLDADRQLCTLWFFTTHSFSNIASLLNYSLNQPLPVRIHGQDAKDRFLELAKSTGYSRAFVYHEVKRLSEKENVEYQPAMHTVDQVFREAWARMQEDVSEERELGKNGECYDHLSDAEFFQRLGKRRLWGVEERKALQGTSWGGLGTKVTRPEGDDLGSQLDIDKEAERAKETMKLGKKKGWVGLAKGLIGL